LPTNIDEEGQKLGKYLHDQDAWRRMELSRTRTFDIAILLLLEKSFGRRCRIFAEVVFEDFFQAVGLQR
jgi:hypothetical protein